MEYVAYGACLLVIVAVAVALAVAAVRRRRPRLRLPHRDRFPRWDRFPRRERRQPISAVCLQCRGTGWIERRERTLEFTGDGFADLERPSTMCTACGGTGRTVR